MLQVKRSGRLRIAEKSPGAAEDRNGDRIMEANIAPLILIVDDNPTTVSQCASALMRAGYRTISAPDGDTALQLAKEHLPDLVLSDIMMPGLDGYQLVEKLRESPRTCTTCIVLMTGSKVAEEDIVRGFECGVDDYVLKPLRMNELVARVKAIIQGAKRRADISPLTGLPGNRLIQEHLSRLVARKQDFSALLVDIDNFKAFNDRYGFERGDSAIKLLGGILLDAAQKTAGEGIFVGHIGGDDFLVVANRLGEEVFARMVMDAFDAKVPELYDPADRERGFVEIEDRRGELARYPIMTLSIACVSSANRRFENTLDVTAVLAEVKNFLKRTSGGRFHMDRRKD